MVFKGTDGNIRAANRGCGISEKADFLLIKCILTEVYRSIKAGYYQLFPLQITPGFILVILMESTGARCQRGMVKIVNLYALKMVLLRVSSLSFPGKILPSSGGKGKIHASSSS